MKITNKKIVWFGTLILALALLASPSLEAKKKKGGSGPKKVVAIGQVSTGQMGFSSMNPGQLGDMLKNNIKKELERTGRYVVVTPAPSKAKPTPEVQPAPTRAPTPQDIAAQMQEMQQIMAQAQGQYVHKPVAAQGLFNFSVHKGGRRSVDTTGLTSTAEYYSQAPIPFELGGFASESEKLSLTCAQLDPISGRVLDQHVAKASSTQFKTMAGVDFYTVSNSEDPDRTFNRLFKRAVKDCVKWMDKKFKGVPWEGQILERRGGQFLVNAGQNANMKPGMLLTAFQRQAVTSGGLALGIEESATGQVEITGVYEAYSTAKTVEGRPAPGNLLKLVAQ
jgi:hypothetical protein